MFISFEGLDGSGKTTQATLLVEKLRNAGHSVEFIREPGGTDISEHIRNVLLDNKNLGMNEITELLLFSAARSQVVHQIIKPALATGEVVICDRYVDSTTAYQGFGRGLDLSVVREINAAATSGMLPDITFFIDVSIDEIIRRRHDSGITVDRMESGGRPFYEKIRWGYLKISEDEKKRILVVNGERAIETIQKELWDIVSRSLNQP
jgi:dTMP kinase